jgi:hypothetical protein
MVCAAGSVAESSAPSRSMAENRARRGSTVNASDTASLQVSCSRRERLLKRRDGDTVAPPVGFEGLLEFGDLAVDVNVAVHVERADAVDQVAQARHGGRQGPAVPLEAADGRRDGFIDDAAELGDDAAEEVIDLPPAPLGEMPLEFRPECLVLLDLRLPGLLAGELARQRYV